VAVSKFNGAVAQASDAREAFLTRSIEALGALAVDIINEDSEAALLENAARDVVGRLGFADCVIYLVKNGGLKLEQVAAHGVKGAKPGGVEGALTLDIGQGVTGNVALTGLSRIVADTRSEAAYVRDLGSGRSELAAPILIDDEVVGVIDSEASTPGFFTAEHLAIFETVAAMVATRIKIIRLNAKNPALYAQARRNEDILSRRVQSLQTEIARLQDVLAERD